MFSRYVKRGFSLPLFLLVAVSCFVPVYSQAKPVLAALNKAESTLAFFDPVSMKLIGKVATGSDPHEVVFSTDGKTAFVSNYGAQQPGSSISVIDVATMKELRRVDLLPLLRPHGLQFIGGKLYFTAETNRVIARYDAAANKVDWLMGTGQNGSHMVAGSADQKRFYTANIGSDSITAFEFQAVPPAQSRVIHIPVGKQPEAIDLSPDGKEVWTGLNLDGAIDIVDTTSNKQTARVAINGRPYRVRFTPDGRSVICTMVATKELLIIDAATKKETARMKLESVPLGVAFSDDGKTAFITVVEPDAVLKIDLEKLVITGRGDPGKGPDGVAVFGF